MTQTKKAPKYFLEIIDYGNKLAENALNNIGLSLNWLDQNKGQTLQEILNKLYKLEENKIKSYLKFRSISYDYAWAKFRAENIDNKWGQAELLDYDPEKKLIKLRTGVVQMVRTFARKIQNKFKDMDITIGPTNDNEK